MNWERGARKGQNGAGGKSRGQQEPRYGARGGRKIPKTSWAWMHPHRRDVTYVGAPTVSLVEGSTCAGVRSPSVLRLFEGATLLCVSSMLSVRCRYVGLSGVWRRWKIGARSPFTAPVYIRHSFLNFRNKLLNPDGVASGSPHIPSPPTRAPLQRVAYWERLENQKNDLKLTTEAEHELRSTTPPIRDRDLTAMCDACGDEMDYSGYWSGDPYHEEGVSLWMVVAVVAFSVRAASHHCSKICRRPPPINFELREENLISPSLLLLEHGGSLAWLRVGTFRLDEPVGPRGPSCGRHCRRQWPQGRQRAR
ncbi:hypothetical protein DFH09DRAFT_1109460 [Mycena vulgaris]|nr:hypothetical protein DFH09DRAFT_1109460 [Mycena vulgaris]